MSPDLLAAVILATPVLIVLFIGIAAVGGFRAACTGLAGAVGMACCLGFFQVLAGS